MMNRYVHLFTFTYIHAWTMIYDKDHEDAATYAINCAYTVYILIF